MPKAKSKAKVTFEMLRTDLEWVADFLDQHASHDDVNGEITPKERKLLRHITTMLLEATHVVIYDANQLPED